MRYYLGWLGFIFMAGYAWRNLLYALCFLIASMVILERPDFPKSPIPGLNAWNFLFLSICAAFILSYSRRDTVIKLPSDVRIYIWYYLFFIVLAFAREVVDFDGINEFAYYMKSGATVNATELFMDDIFNTIKYTIPGLLCYYLAHDRKSVNYLLASVVFISVGLSLLVIKVMPLEALTDGRMLEQTAIRKIDRDIGYYRSDLAILFAGGAWAIFLYKETLKSFWLGMMCYGASFIMLLATALTGGRIGMGALLVVGAVVGWFRMKKLLVFGPLLIAIVIALVPAAEERFFQGIASEEDPYAETDMQSATSGRSEIWPHVWEKIGESPLVGHGRRAMQRIGLSKWLGENLGLPFAHPHNAYMQLLLDNGVLLAIPVVLFWLLLLRRSFSLFIDRRNIYYVIIGGTCFSFVLAQIVGFFGSQSFYPFTSSVSLWCAAGIMLRAYRERELIEAGSGDHKALYADTDAELIQEPPKKKRKATGLKPAL